MFHQMLATWFRLSLEWGYAGVFLMMAVESTVFPLPSEVVIPPAAYWAEQGKFHFWGIVIAATLGSWAGAAISYWVARAVGRPLILKYGKYVFVPERKWLLAEQWIQHFSAGGVFFARLLPVVRHLVSLPAGAARMPFGVFSLTTLLGSFPWSTVLAGSARALRPAAPAGGPEALSHVLKGSCLVGGGRRGCSCSTSVDLSAGACAGASRRRERSPCRASR